MNKKYHKPKKLIIGVLLFGFSMLFLGMLIMTEVKDGIYNIQDTLYAIGFITCIITMAVGEIFILDASSYNVNKTKSDIKKCRR